jgi:hypothetical protein
MKDLAIRVYGGGDDAVRAVEEYLGCREQIVEQVSQAFAKQGWIPVSERMPEEDEDVLVFTKDSQPEMHVASLDEDGIWYPSHGDGWEFPDVTHWMPLPEPPKVTQ